VRTTFRRYDAARLSPTHEHILERRVILEDAGESHS
jgi:hypothetical protein